MKKRGFLSLWLISSLCFAQEIIANNLQITYRSPTARYIEACGIDAIDSSLTRHNLSLENKELFDRISQEEKWGFIGYHSSCQEFRVYQDIIRLVLEEIVKIPIRADFHFFRIPGLPFYDEMNQEKAELIKADRSLFLYMNYSIYGNHDCITSSTYHYYTTNSSSSKIDYEEKIKELFIQLGIDTRMVSSLFAIGRTLLYPASGVLYQIFDNSHQHLSGSCYSLANACCISDSTNEPFSSIVSGTSPVRFPKEIRMILGNKSTLNPYSALGVNRFDNHTPELAQHYLNHLRGVVQKLEGNPKQIEAYRKHLIHLWEEPS